jgi:hypothetical protein
MFAVCFPRNSSLKHSRKLPVIGTLYLSVSACRAEQGSPTQPGLRENKTPSCLRLHLLVSLHLQILVNRVTIPFLLRKDRTLAVLLTNSTSALISIAAIHTNRSCACSLVTYFPFLRQSVFLPSMEEEQYTALLSLSHSWLHPALTLI